MRRAPVTRPRLEINLDVSERPGRRHKASTGYKCGGKTKNWMGLEFIPRTVWFERASPSHIEANKVNLRCAGLLINDESKLVLLGWRFGAYYRYHRSGIG
jgi:hypothetical protein